MTAVTQISVGRVLSLGIAVTMLAASPSFGQLANRYSFTTDATDSVGGQNGTLFGTNGSFTGGQLVLDNTGESSADPGTAGAYLDLPNGLISSAASAGSSGSVTVEMWITMNENRNWAAAFSAGISGDGEDISSGNSANSPYIQIIPRTGDGGQGNDLRATSNSDGAGEGFVDDLGPDNGTDLQVGRKEHIVAVFDQSAGTPGTVTLYRNGGLVGSESISANLDLTTFFRADNTGGDVNNWVGRSQFPDSLLDAQVDELRIYSDVVTAEEALSGTVFGPDAVGDNPIPLIEVDKSTGNITLKNNASAAANIEYYTITSDAGALSTSGWSSLDSQNYNAVDGTDVGSTAGDSDGEGWDAAGGSNANALTELFLAESGSELASSASLNLGSAYNTGIFGDADGDLMFEVGLTGGGLVSLPVVYVGGGGLLGDFDSDGDVDIVDFGTFGQNFGMTGLPLDPPTDGDFEPDGDVDIVDFGTFAQNFGTGTGAGAAVPEPTTFGLALVMAGSLGVYRRR